jgi:hypothetical protein
MLRAPIRVLDLLGHEAAAVIVRSRAPRAASRPRWQNGLHSRRDLRAVPGAVE